MHFIAQLGLIVFFKNNRFRMQIFKNSSLRTWTCTGLYGSGTSTCTCTCTMLYLTHLCECPKNAPTTKPCIRENRTVELSLSCRDLSFCILCYTPIYRLIELAQLHGPVLAPGLLPPPHCHPGRPAVPLFITEAGSSCIQALLFTTAHLGPIYNLSQAFMIVSRAC